jgi:hypothetical protein
MTVTLWHRDRELHDCQAMADRRNTDLHQLQCFGKIPPHCTCALRLPFVILVAIRRPALEYETNEQRDANYG